LEAGSAIIQKLMKLGLTEYEAKAYIALVKLGSAKVSDIHRASGVPITKLYEVLARLENKGWVESSSERPVRYRARPPKDAIRSALEEVNKAGEEALSVLNAIYESRVEMEKSEAWLVKGRRNVEIKLIDMIKNARNKIFLTLTRLAKHLVPLLEDQLAEAAERDIEVYLILHGWEGEQPKIRGVKVVSVAQTPATALGITVIHSLLAVDGEQIFLVLPVGPERTGFKDLTGTWVNDRSLASLVESYMSLIVDAITS